MERETAYKLVREKIKNKNLVNHCLAVEAIMKDTAVYLNEKKGNTNDIEKWAMAGLLHDIDYESTKDDPERHSLEGSKMLEGLGLDSEIVYAVKAHNQVHGLKLRSDMDICLYSADPLSGLIVASALIKPEKKLKAISDDFVLNRFKEKSFAKGANREQIKEIERAGIDLDTFVNIAFEAMLSVSDDLGL